MVLRKVPDVCLLKESMGRTDAVEDALMPHSNPVSAGAFLPSLTPTPTAHNNVQHVASSLNL